VRINVGDIVRVVFMDHAQGEEALEFEVFGRVYSKDRKNIHVVCWGYAAVADREVDDNVHSYTIVRATIKTLEKLKVVTK
jgi:hypothetical protein